MQAIDNLKLPYSNPSYESDGSRTRFFASKFPNLAFYFDMAKVVFYASCCAKKGNYTSERWASDSLAILLAMEKCGTKVYVEGLEEVINRKSPCIFVANHMSTFETFVLPCLIQNHINVTYITKKSLLNFPFFGAIVKARNPITVSRTNLREDLATMLNGSVEKINQGQSIIVFPQASRTYNFNENKFNSIGIKMAKKNNVPIIPIALRSDAWGIGKLIKDFGKINPKLDVHFKFGKAVYVEGNGKAEHEYCLNFIKENLKSWGI